MTRPQKGKHHKRPKAWHRGTNEDRRYRRTRLPDVNSGADPTTGTPQPVKYGPGKRVRTTDVA